MKNWILRCGVLLLALSSGGTARISVILAAAQSANAAAGDAVKLNERGLAHLKKKEYDAAIKLFREALQSQPDYAEALDNLGKALDATGKDEEAIGDFDRALKLAPEQAVIHSNKGLALYHEGKFADAAASFREAIAIHDDFPEAYNGLGASLMGLGKTDEAIAAFRKSIQQNPKNADALNNLGTALLTERKADEALPVLEKAHKLKLIRRKSGKATRTLCRKQAIPTRQPVFTARLWRNIRTT